MIFFRKAISAGSAESEINQPPAILAEMCILVRNFSLENTMKWHEEEKAMRKLSNVPENVAEEAGS